MPKMSKSDFVRIWRKNISTLNRRKEIDLNCYEKHQNRGARKIYSAGEKVRTK